MPDPESPIDLRLPSEGSRFGSGPGWRGRALGALRLLRRRASWAARAGPPESAPSSPPPAAAPRPSTSPPDATPGAPPPKPAGWPDLRERLWGRGFALPGGEAEILRLAGLLPLSPANTLLLIDAGPGGAAAAIATARGCWIAAHEADSSHPDQAAPLLRPHGRRIAIAARDPVCPAFRERGHDHALALEPLRHGGDPASLLAAITVALKAGGQLVLTDVVLGTAGEGMDLLPRWLRAERRPLPPPTESAMRAAFRRSGLHVHVTEELGIRQQGQVMLGWAGLCRAFAEAAERPERHRAAALVTEAEAWLLRLRLLELGRLRLLRWHATRIGS